MLAHLQRIHILAALSTLVVLMAISCPANAQSQIININSRSNNQSNPVNVFLEAGTYQVEPIGTADGGAFNAWNPWSRTSCTNPDGCQRTSPTTVTGWMNNHLVMSSDIVAVTIEGTPGSIDPTIPGYRVDDGFVYPTAIIALGNAQSSVFALSAAGDVGFAIPDAPLWDNAGGMSLRITLESTMSIFPKKGGDTGSVSVHIFGSGFEEGATVKLTRDGESDILGESVKVSGNGALINTTFNLVGKSRGLWDVVITNPDSTAFSLPDGFIIEEGRDPELWVDILGREVIRPGRQQNYWIIYGNKENVDVWGANLFIGIPAGLEYKLEEDPDFRSFSEDTVVELLITLVRVQSSGMMPLVIRAPISMNEFSIKAAISTTNEGFRVEHGTFARPKLSNAFLSDGIEHDIHTLKSISTALNSFDYSEAILPGGTDAPPGYIDYFVIEDPEFGSFGEIGIRTRDNHVAWSYPGEGVTKIPFSEIKDNRFTLPKAKDADGNPCIPQGSCGDKTVTAKHVFSIRPETETNMPAIEEQIHQKLQDWLNNETEFCDPMPVDAQPGDCASCIGLADVLLYPNGTPFGEQGELLTTPDYISYWLKLNKVDGSILKDIITESLLKPGWFTWWLRALIDFRSVLVLSFDPNDKIGSQGVGEANHISGEEHLRYAIFFENIETASAPAQEVIITDQLDIEKIDLKTLSFGPITFGDKFVAPLPGQSNFLQNVDLRPDNNLIVRITAAIDPNTGILTWHFSSIDPDTGEPPEDPLAGFLPPNINPPDGDGSVLFTVMPKEDLTTGTEIRNSASIIFDTNEPIETPDWLNTIDNTKPTTNVLPLTSEQNTTDFEVQWTGTDEGAGIRDYTIFVSEDDGPYTEWLTNTLDTSGTFSGENGKTYAFYSVARDHTGNLEDAPESPDTTTTVVTNQPPEAQCQNVNVPTDPSTCAAGTASVDNGSSDPDGDPITLDQSPPGPYPLGDNAVTLTVMDDKSASDSCDATVTVIDQEPPVINNLAANPNVLWPPNHKMRPVTVTADASDNCDPDPVCKITSVSSNEPVNGTGDGDTSPDWEITGDLTVNLRAERSGTGSGRVYTITVECADASGNSATAEATVTVPHNR